MALLGIPDAIFKDVSFVTISIIILYFLHLQTYLENFLTWHMHVDCPHGNSLDAIVLCLTHDLSCIIDLCIFKNSVTHSTFGTLFIIISSILSICQFHFFVLQARLPCWSLYCENVTLIKFIYFEPFVSEVFAYILW